MPRISSARLSSRISLDPSSNETFEDHLREKLRGLLTSKLFLSYEAFWVFPGRAVLEELNVLLTNNIYGQLEKNLRNVVRFLSHFGDQGLRIYQELSERHDNLDVVLEGIKSVKNILPFW